MPSRSLRRLAAVAATAVTLLVVPVATPASALEVRVMQWQASGTWTCGSGCGSGGVPISGSSGGCGQTGFDVTSASPRVAVNYACTASFSASPHGACAAGVCAVTGGHVSVTVSDPNAGRTQTFSGDIEGGTVSTTSAGVRVLTLRSAGVTSASPATAWSLEAVLNAWGCALPLGECMELSPAPSFAMTLTQTWFDAP